MSPPKNKAIRDELILLQSLSVSNLTIHKAGCIAIDNGAVAVVMIFANLCLRCKLGAGDKTKPRRRHKFANRRFRLCLYVHCHQRAPPSFTGNFIKIVNRSDFCNNGLFANSYSGDAAVGTVLKRWGS